VLARGAHRHRDDLLTDIDPGDPFIHDLHIRLPSDGPAGASTAEPAWRSRV
jgi:hypothetical protein